MSGLNWSAKPRVGFLGAGWIGKSRMQAAIESDLVEVAAVCDGSDAALIAVRAMAPDARLVHSFEQLLELPLDGLVIATPSALHAEQACRALARGVAVFCQKPLGRNAREAGAVVGAARAHDRLLGVDFSYRHTRAMQAVKSLLQSGELGSIYAARFVFHNAYGPDKPWYYDRALSGGGCVMDLGIHLVDLADFLLDSPELRLVGSRLYAKGRRLSLPSEEVEDFATAQLELSDGGVVELVCSWNLPAGCDAVIRAELVGSRGAALFRNLNGSFYDFAAERLQGTSRTRLVSPPDAWSGRALIAWLERLCAREGFNAEAERWVSTTRTIDRIYGAT